MSSDILSHHYYTNNLKIRQQSINIFNLKKNVLILPMQFKKSFPTF